MSNATGPMDEADVEALREMLRRGMLHWEGGDLVLRAFGFDLRKVSAKDVLATIDEERRKREAAEAQVGRAVNEALEALADEIERGDRPEGMGMGAHVGTGVHPAFRSIIGAMDAAALLRDRVARSFLTEAAPSGGEAGGGRDG